MFFFPEMQKNKKQKKSLYFSFSPSDKSQKTIEKCDMNITTAWTGGGPQQSGTWRNISWKKMWNVFWTIYTAE